VSDGNIKLTCRYVTFGIAMHETREYSSCIKYFLELNNYKLGDRRDFVVVFNSFNLEEVCDDGDDDSNNSDQLLVYYVLSDRLCGLMVRVPGYRSSGPRFDFRRYQIF
jgi:hypothetical protein